MFNSKSGIGEDRDLPIIPSGTIAWARLKVKEGGIAQNQNGGSRLECDFIIQEGPFQGRHVFDNLGNPFDSKGSEKYREIAEGQLTRVLETAGVFEPGNDASYEKLNGFYDKPWQESAVALASQIDDTVVGIRLKVEKGTKKSDGSFYPDKNRIAEFFSPNPESYGHKGWQKLKNGEGNEAAPAATLSAPAPAEKPAWLAGA